MICFKFEEGQGDTNAILVIILTYALKLTLTSALGYFNVYHLINMANSLIELNSLGDYVHTNAPTVQWSPTTSTNLLILIATNTNTKTNTNSNTNFSLL